jgi:hypothetical protein
MRRIIFCALSILLFNNLAYATHFRGGHISIKQLSKTSFTCRITITVYTNTQTAVLFGGRDFNEGDLLDFGDGSPRVLVPEIGPGKTPPGSTYIILDAARGIAKASYTIDHVYPEPGRHLVSYREANRNAGIVNIFRSVDTPFYIESSFTLDSFTDKAYSTPNFLAEPIFYTTSGGGLSYSMAALDSNDYELLYELTTPKMEIGQDVFNFKLPEAFSINQFNGMITWDSKFQDISFQVGEYIYAVKVYQIKDSHVIGYTIRDFQIILEDGDFGDTISDNRDLDENNRIYVGTGNSFTFKVFAEDSDATSLEAFSELSGHSNSFSFTSYDSTHETKNIKVGVVSITSSPELLRDNPYAIVVRGHYKSDKYAKDLGYLFYTKDIEIPGLPPVVSTEQELLLINTYPNPVKDFLKIEDVARVNKSIKIFSTSGQTILEKKNFKEDIVDLNGIPPGVYILQIQFNSFVQKTFRIIKSE